MERNPLVQKPRREKRQEGITETQEHTFLGYLESTLSLELKAHYCTCQMTSGSKQNGALVLCGSVITEAHSDN